MANSTNNSNCILDRNRNSAELLSPVRLKNWSVTKISGTNYWIVDRPFFWLLDYEEKDGWVIVVEEGFKTNMGSIPRVLWAIFNPTAYNGYILHDWLYKSKMKYHIKNDEYEAMTRKEIDLMLIEILEYEGASFLEKFFIYLAVRLFGWLKF